MTGPKGLSRDGRLRSSWQVLAVYIGASWVVLQVVDVLKDNMGLPDWVFPFAVVLLLIGLPIMLVTALIQGRSAPDEDEATEPGQTATPKDDLSPRRLFTWRNALLGGAAAFVLLAVVTTGFMFMRTRGIGPVGSLVAKGVLEERSRVVLAEFGAEDEVLARTVTESFRVDLAQSPVVELVEPDSIADALARMDRPADTRLDESTARELAVRDGIPAVVTGEVASLGAGYALTARLVAAGDGAVLASARASARSQDGLLDAIDEASSSLREQIGESYSSLRATPSLAHVTTGSLEALKKYTQAQDARHLDGNPEAALRLLEEAIAIDSTFALAWRDLATILGNQRGSWARRIDAAERAYRFRDRLSERERYLVEANYYQEIADEPRKVIETYQAMLRLDSLDAQALNNIGFTYFGQANFEEALEWYERSHEAAPDVPLHLANVATTQANLGDFEAADSLYAELDSVTANPQWDLWRGAYLWLRGDEEGARATYEGVVREHATRPAATTMATGALVRLDLVRGRLRNATVANRAMADRMLAAGEDGPALEALVAVARWRLAIANDTAGALAALDAAVERIDPDSIPPLDRPWDAIAGVLLEAGEVERGRAVIEEGWSTIPELLQPSEEKYKAGERARIARAEGRPLEALEDIRSLPPWTCVPCRARVEAGLLDEAGRADSAIVLYERYLDTPYNFRLYPDGAWLARTHERLGQLYDSRGDLERAAVHYARFVELWEEADPELQPRVEAARARLEQIVRARG